MSAGMARLRLLMAGVVLAGAACAAEGSVQVSGRDPVVVVHGSSSAMQMRAEATLAYDGRSRCLRLEFPDGSSVLPVWPVGTRPLHEQGRRGVMTAESLRIVEGEVVVAGGGYVEWPAEQVELPAGCLPPGGDFNVFVIGPGSPVTTGAS